MEKKKHETIIIFGLGGVGSWTANFIMRQKLAEELILIDFDTVEPKNIERQSFYYSDIGNNKATTIANDIKLMISEYGESKEVRVYAYNKKIEDEIDLIGYNKEAIAIIATDNIKSKRTIAQHFNKKIIINCDNNLVEIKNHLDKDEKNAWDLGRNGYNSEQNIISNIEAAIKIITILKRTYWTDRKYSIRTRPETELMNKINTSIRNDGEQE